MTKVYPNIAAAQPQEPWIGVNNKLWRYTIGRVSNLVRLPINMAASVFQSAKIVGKVLALPVTYSVVGIYAKATKQENYRYEGSMSLRGIALSGIELLGLLKGVAGCYIRAICAPQREDQEKRDFVKGIKGVWGVVKGTLPGVSNTYSLSRLFQKYILKT